MFLGEYHHSIDAKGRLTVPARFRQLLEDGGYITMGFDSNVVVMPKEYFEARSKVLQEQNITDLRMRQLSRLWFSQAERIAPDGSGRIMVPQFLRNKRGLDADVVLVGSGDYFEIWPPAEWNEEAARIMKDAAEGYSEIDMSASGNG
ncbi:MAG: division/cell wall cluster transcriptional repressor MraZ [Anaerolineales bacterium]|nr:division/cell wall cluster transcriptional repressor MraZ [Anaerolineales bacterium]MCW5856391.1 division/cell wall cluster transcriptional repressor MraZ [Anaerolineales bacterium]